MKFNIVPNKIEFQVVNNNPHMLEFDGSTTVNQVDIDAIGFVRFPFQLVEFHNVQPTQNKTLVDVIGCVTNIEKATKTTRSSRTLDFNLVNDRGQILRVTLWGDFGDELLLKKSNTRQRSSSY